MEKYILPNEEGLRTFEEFCNLNDVTPDDKEAREYYIKNNWSAELKRGPHLHNKNLTEGMYFMNYNVLIDKIKYNFGNYMERVHMMNNGTENYIFISINKDYNPFVSPYEIGGRELMHSEQADDFYALITSYNMYIMSIMDMVTEYTIVLNSLYTTDLYDKKKNIKKVYHIEYLGDMDRPIAPKVTSRHLYTDEMYYDAVPNNIIVFDGNIKQLQSDLRSFMYLRGTKFYKLLVTEINFEKYPFNIWSDLTFDHYDPNHNIGYTYAYIPEMYINRVYKNEEEVVKTLDK